jgi:hypothetical protein
MKSQIPFRTATRKRGVALVIVISLIAMLTVVTVALLLLVGQSTQRTASEVAAQQSEALAQTAFEIMLSDLSDEMARGATSVSETKRPDGSTYRVYDLTGRRQAMRVTASVNTGAPGISVLVKQSQPTKAFHTWPPIPAKIPPIRSSTVGTETGKTPFAPALWLTPKLLAPTATFTTATAPKWIYLARNGSNPKTFNTDLRREKLSGGVPNPTFVLGRYAYNLYDTSGMLDINVAGLPSSGGPNAETVADKGTLLTADISILPGMTAARMDLISRWRHQWSADPAVTSNYLLRSDGAGWRTMFANDNSFLSRQDLLDFWKTNGLANDTLPFLTHFSRDLDAPSFRPDPSRPRVKLAAVNGGNDAFGSDDLINPDIMAYDSGREGPKIHRRFPLERLTYVATPKDTAPLDPKVVEKAEKYFGLRWDPTEGVWLYIHARPNGSISTLANVPLDRDPNFFELLKAAINVGSLGRQMGTEDIKAGFDSYRLANAAAANQASKHHIVFGSKASLDASVDLQILQFGACIIDQADADSFPTTIRLNKPDTDPLPRTPFYVSGKEDVPYAVMTQVIPYRGKTLGATVYNHNWTTGNYDAVAGSKVYEVNTTMQVKLWRPHQPATTYDGPVNFRIRAEHAEPIGGGSRFWTYSGWRMPGDPKTYEVTHYGRDPNDHARQYNMHPSIVGSDKDHTFQFEHVWGTAVGVPAPTTVPCTMCGFAVPVTFAGDPDGNGRLSSGASLVPFDRAVNNGSNYYNSPQSNGDYTHWGGPDYSSDTVPKVLDGTESIIVNVPPSSRAFREPQTVHSTQHGTIAGYAVTGNMVETRDGDFQRSQLPTNYTQVAGFRLNRSMTAEVDVTGYARPNHRGNMLELRLGLAYFLGGPIDVIMEYQVPGTTQWRLYQRSEFGFSTVGNDGWAYGDTPARWDKALVYTSYLIDPRTSMWGGIGNIESLGSFNSWTDGSWNGTRDGRTGRYEKVRWNPADATQGAGQRVFWGFPLFRAPATYYGWNIYNWNGSAYANPGNNTPKQFHAVVENDELLWEPGNRRKANFSYKDADDVLRYGVAQVNDYDAGQFLGNPMVTRYGISATGALTQSEALSGRPQVLNRPFRSLGELGYVFRGTPWRDIEFLHPTSPDAALLDIFCLNEELDADGNEVEHFAATSASTPRKVAPVVAGRVNLNSAGVDVVASLIKGSSREKGGTTIDTAEARSLATVFVSAVRGVAPVNNFQPMTSRGEMVSQPKQAVAPALADGSTTGIVKRLSDAFTNVTDRSIKDRRQVVTRALSSGTTVRTWTFMMDLVVQSGRLAPASASLTDFNAAAERRYWIHFSIDRITGEVLDVQWERVSL